MTELGIELNDTSVELGIELGNEAINYNGLINKPQINGTTLEGNKTGSQLGLAQADEVYTKTQTDTLLNAKADKSTTYTKTETDTLLNAKVDKVNGKGLSTNDYTNEDKAKVQSAIQPNDNISELTNDAGYITSSYHDATKQDVISDLASIRQGASKGATSVQPSDISDMATKTWTNAQGFLKEHQSLANYYNKSETDAQISNHHDSSKQDTLVSGTNIKTINNQSLLGSGDITISGGVESVNGQTGVVVLDAEDVGALPSTTAIPTKTSDLTNDGDGTNPFLTQHQSLANYSTTTQMNTAISNATNDMATQTWVGQQGYLTEHQSLSNYYNKSETNTLLGGKQATLVSGTNIKTINNNSLLGSGNIVISGGGEPAQYIKNASVSGNTLTLIKKDDSTVVFTPSGSGGDEVVNTAFPILVSIYKSLVTDANDLIFVNNNNVFYI